jgi:hypothetical protein
LMGTLAKRGGVCAHREGSARLGSCGACADAERQCGLWWTSQWLFP